jgi:hypothetical protein
MKNVVFWDVSEERIASIFRVEESASREQREEVAAARSTQRHIPEDDILHSHRFESLKSYIVKSSSRLYNIPTDGNSVACTDTWAINVTGLRPFLDTNTRAGYITFPYYLTQFVSSL